MVHYVGVAWSDGQQFDASWDRGESFDFRLGAGQVIQGWDEGVPGMKVGGRRRLTIPPEKGYGSRGAGGVIKGGETLVFVVDLLGGLTARLCQGPPGRPRRTDGVGLRDRPRVPGGARLGR